MKRCLTIAGGLLALVVIAGATAHAAAPVDHGTAECVTCGLCEWVHSLLT